MQQQPKFDLETLHDRTYHRLEQYVIAVLAIGVVMNIAECLHDLGWLSFGAKP